MMNRFATLLLLVCPIFAAAQELGFDPEQGQFRELARQLGAALSYSGQAPARRGSFFSQEVQSPMAATSVGDTFTVERPGSRASGFVVPLLRRSSAAARHVDVGSFSAASGYGDARLYGLSARYTLAKRQAGQPPLAALRATYSGLEGEDVVDVSSQSLELAFTRPTDGPTPYWGIGQVWVSAEPEGGLGSETERVLLDKRYVGFSVDHPGQRLAFEIDQTGGLMTAGARLSFDF